MYGVREQGPASHVVLNAKAIIDDQGTEGLSGMGCEGYDGENI